MIPARGWKEVRPRQPTVPMRGNHLHRPVLILHGTQDMTFPVQLAQRLHAAVPSSQLQTIDQAGHMAHFEQPSQWATAVIDFLQD